MTTIKQERERGGGVMYLQIIGVVEIVDDDIGREEAQVPRGQVQRDLVRLARLEHTVGLGWVRLATQQSTESCVQI
jgi:hypothetical protein